jgi:hypothetical protein
LLELIRSDSRLALLGGSIIGTAHPRQNTSVLRWDLDPIAIRREFGLPGWLPHDGWTILPNPFSLQWWLLDGLAALPAIGLLILRDILKKPGPHP